MTERLRILVVEDEPSVADALGLVLSDSGYDVTIALTGRDGIEKAVAQCFDVAITDLRLPDISGFEVMTNILQNQPDSLIIAITAHYTADVVAESVRRGAVEVLAKPFVPSDILALLQSVLTPHALSPAGNRQK